MIQISHLSKRFAHQPLFEDLSLTVGDKARLGLIGRNGCGKSTLLKMLMGLIEPDAGNISRSPGLSVNYLSQEPQVTPTHTLEEEMRTVFMALNAVQAEETELIERLGSLTGSEQEAALHRLDFLHREMARLDANTVDAQISRTLKGLGFPHEALQRKVGEFSGGWQMRINLAKILLESADVLLLDEPTNHLDLEACEWLEGFLKDYPGAVVVVSHDRRFLDQVTTETAEIELGKITHWHGNYSAFLKQKAEQLESLTAAHDRQQKELAKQSAFVERFRASATRSTQAKSREKQLEKIERIEIPQTENLRMKVRFPSPQASGKQVLTLRGVAKAFGEKRLFQNLDADLQRQQRIFLLGANGCGKTTLFRLILGSEPLDQGEIRPGHNVLLGYFAQNQLETLDATLSVFDTLQNACPKFTQTEVRNMLARFLFRGETVLKPVSVLSGGEKSKLALAKLMVEGPNTLLLDEPTNHMDIAAKEVLEEAFQEYDGTLLCISHDRYFIQQLATDIWEIYEGHLIQYPGDYEYYLFKRDELRAQVLQAASPKTKQPESKASISETTPGLSPLQTKRSLEKQLGQLEKNIIQLETELADIAQQMNNPEISGDYNHLQELSERSSQKHQMLTDLNAQWEVLAETMGS